MLRSTYFELHPLSLRLEGGEVQNKVASEISLLIPEGGFIYNDTISLSSLEELRRIEFECNILRHFFYRKDWSFSYKRHFYSKETTIIKKLKTISIYGIDSIFRYALFRFKYNLLNIFFRYKEMDVQIPIDIEVKKSKKIRSTLKFL